jgi:hypothetical protein
MTRLDEIIASLPPLGEDDAAYAVLADWLQAQGDPWGDLIMLQHRGMTEHAAALLRLRGNDMLGDIHRNPDHVLEWHVGFLRRVTLRTTTDKRAVLDAVRALAKLPCARRLEALVLDARPESFATTQDWRQSCYNIDDPWPDWDDLGPLLVRELPVPNLAFGAWPAAPEHAYVQMPSLDMIGRWFHGAHLARLSLTGNWSDSRSEVLTLASLRELALHVANGGERVLQIVSASGLPALERLTIGLGGEAHCILDDVYAHDDGGYPDTYSPADLASLDVHDVAVARIDTGVFRTFLDGLPPDLADLSFTSSVLVEPLLGAIVAHPRVLKLRHLDLSACAITDQMAQALLASAAPLSQIGSIDLARNRFSDAMRERLTRALPNAVLGERQTDPDFFMRYVATME